jgi:hypothetical protein
MDGDEVVYLVYVDNPDWYGATSATDWRQFISNELRCMWPSFTYEQKWAIAQNADTVGHGGRGADGSR